MFDPHLSQAAQRRGLATELRALNVKARIAKVRDTCVDTGGSIIEPNPKDTWGPVYAEINILGLYHSGDDMEAAIENWIASALRAAPSTQPQQAQGQ